MLIEPGAIGSAMQPFSVEEREQVIKKRDAAAGQGRRRNHIRSDAAAGYRRRGAEDRAVDAEDLPTVIAARRLFSASAGNDAVHRGIQHVRRRNVT